MAVLGIFRAGAKPGLSSDEQFQAQCRRQLFWYELYALAVLIGFELSVVYVIGTLVIRCFEG
ncbi:MAG TPA: hypothetical protein PKG54_12630 [Phycisphaerae bacterium]|jgi:hypothetical protein|nr:hypothetical protein [Phycisphaerae bacterium]HOB75357.1 hypothetical protein [Phycisphaerae bacterium]HOJ55519.1 hypothetical protein [Phycisphaerae bacterium]HOL26029.1 hypothetical protein [Phycisphaerae bacterium]HPP22549.1 hypothetical protein [Phycisphaerae bacterium]